MLNGQVDGAYDKVRQIVASVYDYEYRTFNNLYGESNDDDDLGRYGEDRVESPFQQFSPKGRMRPSDLSPLTPQDENGFAGLDAPLN